MTWPGFKFWLSSWLPPMALQWPMRAWERTLTGKRPRVSHPYHKEEGKRELGFQIKVEPRVNIHVARLSIDPTPPPPGTALSSSNG